ncbi:Cloroperoxidase [Mycena rebaudengoi]|nr:Cloroperoxidase [Mycena rebaudengoi]
MHFNIPSLALALAFFAATNAFPDIHQKHKFIAPGPTDSRSPCPGLNTFANHGYLPRNISIPLLMDATLKGFNQHWDTILLAAKFGLFASEDVTSFQEMRLDALSLSQPQPHRARRVHLAPGLRFGDHIKFNESVYATVANSNPKKNCYNPVSASKVQRNRLAHSVATNPNVTNTSKEFKLRSRETALYLSIFGDPLTGIAPKKFVNIFFREERLPIAEGWKKPTTLVEVATTSPLEKVIRAASEWTMSQACEPLKLGPSVTLSLFYFLLGVLVFPP